jgi:hypothetical protein
LFSIQDAPPDVMRTAAAVEFEPSVPDESRYEAMTQAS